MALACSCGLAYSPNSGFSASVTRPVYERGVHTRWPPVAGIP